MQVSIKVVGFVETLSMLTGVGAAGKSLSGPIATFSSLLPYASFIETGRSNRPQVRRAGPALMFQRGVAEAAAAAPGILGPAIPRGPAAIGAGKRRLRDLGIERIRALTPVRTGALRASVRVLERPT